MSASTAVVALARTALDAAQRAGLSRDDLLRRAGVAAELVDDPDGRIPVDQLLKLWHVAAEASGDPWFGLHAGEQVTSARSIHLVGFAAKSSASLRECYERTAMFAAVTNEASEIAVVHERGRHAVVVGPRPGLAPWPRVYADMALAAYLCLGRRWVGRDVVPTAVAFQHPRPDDISEYERLFRCAPQFNAAKNRLVFDTETLALPLGTTDPEMLAYFDGRAQLALEEAQHATLEHRVRAAIDRVLGVKPPTLAHVARLLATSARTLQRHLADERLSFTELVDDVRRVRALQLLATRDVDLATIAARTGYRDLGTFRAAVQRWTGRSPRDLRK